MVRTQRSIVMVIVINVIMENNVLDGKAQDFCWSVIDRLNKILKEISHNKKESGE